MIRAMGMLACAATILTACASGGGHSGHTGAASTTAPPAASQPAGSPSAGVGTPAVTAPGPSAIQAWYLTVSPRFTRLQRSITGAQTAVRRLHHRGLSTACKQVRSNVRTLQSSPVAPNVGVRRALEHALAEFGTAATLCLAGDLIGSGAAVSRGHRWAMVVTARLMPLLD